jgi:hypothetical protein
MQPFESQKKNENGNSSPRFKNQQLTHPADLAS